MVQLSHSSARQAQLLTSLAREGVVWNLQCKLRSRQDSLSAAISRVTLPHMSSLKPPQEGLGVDSALGDFRHQLLSMEPH